MILDELKRQFEKLTSERRQSLSGAALKMSLIMMLISVLRLIFVSYSGKSERFIEFAIPMGITFLIFLSCVAVAIFFAESDDE